MRGYDSLYISPHFDDAVLSCAGRILRESRNGSRVAVVTLFSRGGEDRGSRELYTRRKEEDEEACSLLGAETLHLDYPDAPYRNPFYQSFRQIVLESHPDDERILVELGESLGQLCREINPRQILLPLGVGTHVDHRLTFEAARGLETEYQVLFYEDRPYTFLRGSVLQRFRQLGIRSDQVLPADLSDRPSRELVREYVADLRTAAYIQAYLPEGRERFCCALRLARCFRRIQSAGNITLHLDVVFANIEDFEQITKGIGCYRSQIPDLFGSVGMYVKEAKRYATLLGSREPYCERYWRPSEQVDG